ncbi:MAG: class I tRNA ligase family protein, partial [bacterium]|nr:class I tRNA ligase family protein [bacterium]
METQKAYDPKTVEDKIYKLWEESGFFAPSKTGKPFTIVLPPPNITGELHMGHALNTVIQDVL